VACPWHAWRFCIYDGKWCDSPKLKVDAFEVRVEGDQIQVKVPFKGALLFSNPPGSCCFLKSPEGIAGPLISTH